MRHADAAELLEGLVDVTDPDPLPGIVGAAPLLLPRSLDLWGQMRQVVLIVNQNLGK